jgi:ssDNA-binding replication factor A large subunit
LSSIPLTRIEVLDEIVKERPAWEDIRHVIALESGLSTWVKGTVLEVVETPKLIALCETCGSPLKASKNEYTCENCKQPRSGKFVLTGRVRIDDGTGVADVIFPDLDEQALPILNLADVKYQMLKNHECEIPLSKEQFSKVIGREIEVYGTANKSPENSKFELIAKKALMASAL